jgi:hypothetical protein
LDKLQIPSGLQVTNSGTNTNLNFSLNFKGVQTFLEKSDKFSKIPTLHDILKYEFIMTHFYSNIGSSFTSGRRDFVYFIPKRGSHLSILLPLSQVHHCTKLSK